ASVTSRAAHRFMSPFLHVEVNDPVSTRTQYTENTRGTSLMQTSHSRDSLGRRPSKVVTSKDSGGPPSLRNCYWPLWRRAWHPPCTPMERLIELVSTQGGRNMTKFW